MKTLYIKFTKKDINYYNNKNIFNMKFQLTAKKDFNANIIRIIENSVIIWELVVVLQEKLHNSLKQIIVQKHYK